MTGMQKHRHKRQAIGAAKPKGYDLSLLEAMVRQRAIKSGRPVPKANTTPLAASVRLPYGPKKVNIEGLEKAVAEVRALELG